MGFPAISALITALLLLLLIPLLLLFCQCGTFGKFSDLPFETREYLIHYNTESKGEDKTVPLMLAPFAAPFAAEHQTALCSASNNAAMVQSAHAFDTRVLNKELNQGLMDVESMYGYQLQTQHALMSTQRNIHQSASFRQNVYNIYEEIALPNEYLHGYFSQKAKILADSPALIDSVLVYNDEGQYSLDALDLDSTIEADNDLSFLNDLEMKYFDLATICNSQPAKSEQVEQIVKSAKTSPQSESSVASDAVQVVKCNQPPPQHNTNTNVSETINYQSTNTTVSEAVNEFGSMNASSTFLMQQPLYCLVEHQPVQGMYLINGVAGAQGLVLQGGNILQDAVKQQEMYLIDGMSMLQGNLMLDNCTNLVSAGSLAVSPVLVQREKGRQQLQVSLPQDAQPDNSKAKEKPDVESGIGKNAKPAKLQLNKHT